MDQDAGYRYQYYLTPTWVSKVELAEPSLAELARVIKAGVCIEASFKRGKGEAGMDAYKVRTWEGWHHHMALSLIAVWFLLGETHRGQQVTPALTLPQVRYGLSVLLMEVFCTLSIPSSSTCEVRGRIVRWQTNERPVLLRSTLSISSQIFQVLLSICRHVQRQLMRNELAHFYH